ncbi:hypothetical protein [Lacinutrix venerupis]|uniref:Uncharacterized protein n=1 Tax=Lacinutrix venerupis TaxID=1486034 RepID=A0AAC9LK07_9FLAO|nr:hypothetical protein [Lacinutrix venerupis]APX99804.1 hypothetical protein BWR22_05595 [Lacinutrix venerupis]
MKTNMNIEEKVTKTLEVFDTMDTVKAPPFFKDKTMQLLFAEKEEKVTPLFWSWFTPQLQLATLVCVVLVNFYAIKEINNSEYESSISSFASDYGIAGEQESSIFNF